MKWVNGRRIIKEVLDSYVEYEQLSEGASIFIERLLDDLHYQNRKITADTFKHFFEYKEHLFEDNILDKLREQG